MQKEKSISKMTPEEIFATRPLVGFQKPGFKYKSLEELKKKGISVKVTHDDKTDEESIKDELIARGYSGYYREETDGTIIQIIPLDKDGSREDTRRTK